MSSDNEELSPIDKLKLEGDEAISLWLKGEEAWNQWCDDNPQADILFTNVDFGTIVKQHSLKEISFVHYRFPTGNVYFSNAAFGDCNVNFRETLFGDGYVVFTDAVFGGSNVSFHNATFGDGDIHFIDVSFGNANIDFQGTNFGKNRIFFSRIQTSKGVFNFRPEYLGDCQRLDMSNSTIESSLNFSGIDCPTVLNLQGTRLSHPVDFDRANIRFRTNRHFVVLKKAINPADSASFRRLKKIAQDGGDHDRALDFYANEMRSAYWYTITGPTLALYYLYDWLSDYGRSILRPIIAMIISIWIYAQIYIRYATESTQELADAIVFSAVHIVPIYPGLRGISNDLAIRLFGDKFPDTHWSLIAVIASQYILSSILLFLLLLALRNRFRS